MTLGFPPRTGLSALEHELVAERASTLGNAGRAAEAALAALAARKGKGDEGEIERLIDLAAQAVWALFVQREICGMTNGQDVVDRYAIPSGVLARLGATPRHLRCVEPD